MTECAPRIACKPIDCVDLLEDVGTLVSGCSVKIEDGEILVKSPSVMAGYYKDPEETAKSLTPDGWLRTGDLGYVDEENRLFLTGRKKNLIILSGGENVSPEELENKFDDCIFIVTANDFLKIMSGEMNPVWAFTTGKLKVQGSIEKALEFQKISDRVKSNSEKK